MAVVKSKLSTFWYIAEKIFVFKQAHEVGRYNYFKKLKSNSFSFFNMRIRSFGKRCKNWRSKPNFWMSHPVKGRHEITIAYNSRYKLFIERRNSKSIFILIFSIVLPASLMLLYWKIVTSPSGPYVLIRHTQILVLKNVHLN